MVKAVREAQVVGLRRQPVLEHLPRLGDLRQCSDRQYHADEPFSPLLLLGCVHGDTIPDARKGVKGLARRARVAPVTGPAFLRAV